jgi:glycosyltransferase involved in cell wall biosynthesis
MYKEIIFSIIIPHKNSPDLLQRCLDSIPRREDVQIVIVDDNSDETIVDFNNFPGMNENFVKIYLTKEDKGAGYARNVGIKNSKGKWILFADADDFFTENAFDYFFSEINSIHEIIYFKITSCYYDTLQYVDRAERYNAYIDNYIINRAKNSEDWLRYKFSTPWGKMIKRELILRKNIWFDEIKVSNDAMFSLFAGHYATSIDAKNKIIYCYTITKGSLTNTFSRENLMSRYIVALRYNDFLKKQGKHKYQSFITIYYLLSSIKYGIILFFQFIRLAIKYKSNTFIGVHRWLSTYGAFLKEKRKRKEYIIKK